MDTSPRKLIFYSTVGPDHDAAAWAPFRLAQHAAEAGPVDGVTSAGPTETTGELAC